MQYNLTEGLALVAVIDPQDAATTAKSTGWIDASKFGQLVGVALAGAITGTVDAKFQQATSAAGAGAKDVAGRAITQIAATGDNKQALVNLRPDQHLDIDNGFRYVRFTITPTGGTTNLLGGAVFGGELRDTPAGGQDATSVAEIVS